MMRLLCLLCLTVSVVSAQSAPPRKDIPTIAKAANGAIVSIVMSDKDGHAIAQGSGFLISKDGCILTNYHVIENGSSAVAKLPDGAFFVVDGVLAFDKDRDIAVIKARGANFHTLSLGNSDRLQVGEEVVAIGNPLSLESTVSNGIVSGIRTVENKGGKFLQVTAPISPGSSGGPLFNLAGEVVGITTLHIEGGENLNFAIPVNDVKRTLQYLPTKTTAFPNEPQTPSGGTRDDNGPSLKATLDWLVNFSVEHGGVPDVNGVIGEVRYGEAGAASNILDTQKQEGCSISLSSFWITGPQFLERTASATFDLSAMDPESIRVEVGRSEEESYFFHVGFARSDAHPIKESVFDQRDPKPQLRDAFSPGLSISFDSKQAADEFGTALKHAIQLCGGKHLF